jgi:uncharacterized protein
MKWLVLVAVLAIAGWFALARRRLKRPPPPAPPAPPAARIGAIVACAHCGVHVPEAEALRDAAGHAYCGEAHRDAGPGR